MMKLVYAESLGDITGQDINDFIYGVADQMHAHGMEYKEAVHYGHCAALTILEDLGLNMDKLKVKRRMH